MWIGNGGNSGENGGASNLSSEFSRLYLVGALGNSIFMNI